LRSSWQNINRAIRGALESLSLTDMIRPTPPMGSFNPLKQAADVRVAGGAV